MAVHNVSITKLPTVAIGKSDIVIDVLADDTKLGALHVSQGAVVWYPSNTKKCFKLEWEAFDAVMQEYGKRTETRS